MRYAQSRSGLYSYNVLKLLFLLIRLVPVCTIPQASGRIFQLSHLIFLFYNAACKCTCTIVSAIEPRLQERPQMRHAHTLRCVRAHITQQMDYVALNCLLVMENVAVRFVAMDCVAVDCRRVGF